MSKPTSCRKLPLLHFNKCFENAEAKQARGEGDPVVESVCERETHCKTWIPKWLIAICFVCSIDNCFFIQLNPFILLLFCRVVQSSSFLPHILFECDIFWIYWAMKKWMWHIKKKLNTHTHKTRSFGLKHIPLVFSINVEKWSKLNKCIGIAVNSMNEKENRLQYWSNWLIVTWKKNCLRNEEYCVIESGWLESYEDIFQEGNQRFYRLPYKLHV